jgi:P-type conjugative transfer protein TrbG
MIRVHRHAVVLLVVTGAPIGCGARAPETAATYVRAEAAADPSPIPTPPVAPAPEPIAPSSQLRPMPGRTPPPAKSAAGTPKAVSLSPQQVVADANHKASQAPASSDTFNAIVQYSYEAGSLYQVFAAPMRITDIALEPGEKILGQPASGDVVRWLLALGKSMDHGVDQWHVYLKPTRPELETNLAINTDRRSYMLELHSYADTYMAAVVWRYPEDELARWQTQASELATEESPVHRSSASMRSTSITRFKSSRAIRPGRRCKPSTMGGGPSSDSRRRCSCGRRPRFSFFATRRLNSSTTASRATRTSSIG